MEPIEDKNIIYGNQLTFEVIANDPDYDPLSYSANSLPQGAVFDENTRIFSWTPQSHQTGDHIVTFTVSDVEGLYDQETITITVLAQIEIIIDNKDPNTSRNGKWLTSKKGDPWGTNSLYTSSIGRTFRWIPDISESFTYKVYAYWVPNSKNSTNVPYSINHANGLTVVNVNQKDASLGGQWNYLGTFTLNTQENNYIEISSENGRASADAVRIINY